MGCVRVMHNVPTVCQVNIMAIRESMRDFGIVKDVVNGLILKILGEPSIVYVVIEGYVRNLAVNIVHYTLIRPL